TRCFLAEVGDAVEVGEAVDVAGLLDDVAGLADRVGGGAASRGGQRHHHDRNGCGDGSRSGGHRVLSCRGPSTTLTAWCELAFPSMIALRDAWSRVSSDR